MGQTQMPKILVAEDDGDVRSLICSTLDKAGYCPLVAVDGPSALATAEEQRPELIVLDLMLPGMNGLDVCRALKSGHHTNGIRVIMLTAKSEESDRRAGLESGEDDYVTKPFSPRDLIQRIGTILSHS